MSFVAADCKAVDDAFFPAADSKGFAGADMGLKRQPPPETKCCAKLLVGPADLPPVSSLRGSGFNSKGGDGRADAVGAVGK